MRLLDLTRYKASGGPSPGAEMAKLGAYLFYQVSAADFELHLSFLQQREF